MTDHSLRSRMRGYLIDCHRNALEEVSFKDYDAVLLEEALRQAGLDHMIVYAKDHWGWSYYPSRVGPVHPKLEEAGLDLLGSMLEAADRAGVEAAVYYSVDTDHLAAVRHPEWTAVDEWGQRVTAGGRWKRCCIAHGYGDYMLEQIEELLGRYRPKGIFFDCFPSVLCFCERCRESFRQRTGREMPQGDEAHRRWKELYRYEEEGYWLPFARKLRVLIDRVSPGTLLTTNGCNLNMPESVRELYDYHFAEPWAGNYLSAGLIRDGMKHPQIGPGNIGMVYDTTPAEAVQRELLSIGMQGARPFLYSESMDISGGLVRHEWERNGIAFAKIKEVEDYWKDAVPIRDVTILYSEASHRNDPDRRVYQQNWWERSSKHAASLQAAMSLCASLHRSYGSVLAEHGQASACGRLLLVPNARVLSLEAWRELTRYVEQGGRLVMALDGMPEDLQGERGEELSSAWEQLLGCRLLSGDDRYGQNGVGSYLRVVEPGVLEPTLERFPLAVAGPRLAVRSAGADCWAEFLAPELEVDVAAERWLAWRPPGPSGRSMGPAVLRHRYGRGEAVLFCFDIFTMARGALAMETGLAVQEAQAWHWPGVLLKDLLTRLSPPEVRFVGLPEQVRVSVTERGGQLLVHVLNQVPSLPLRFGIRVDGGRRIVGAARIYPYRCPLDIEESGEGSVSIRVSADSLYTVLALEQEV